MTPRLTRLIALVAVCVAAMGFSAGSANAAKGLEVAVQDDATFLLGLRSPFKGLTHAKRLKVTWIRVNLTWKSVLKKQGKAKRQPKRLRYRWRAWDDIVRRARRRGIAVQLTVTGPAPRWATGRRKKSGIYKPNAKKFGAFARAAARHFRGKVRRYSIWVEPNLKVWLAPMKRSPKIYRALYAAAYKNIKRVSRRNQVLIGETAPYATPRRTIAPLRFLRGVTCVNRRYRGRRCKGLRTDGYAHHPYDYKHKFGYRYPGKDNVTISTLRRLTKALSKLRKARALTTPSGGVPYVYLTEFGYFSAGTGRARRYNISKKKHASYLVKGFRVARKNKRVKQMLQYILVTPPKKYGFFQTQIMNRRFKPYPAYRALRRWATREAKRGGIRTKP
jgi:hypothetical protein